MLNHKHLCAAQEHHDKLSVISQDRPAATFPLVCHGCFLATLLYCHDHVGHWRWPIVFEACSQLSWQLPCTAARCPGTLLAVVTHTMLRLRQAQLLMLHSPVIQTPTGRLLSV